MEIFKSDYKTTEYDEHLSVIINRWTDVPMDDSIFQEEILIWLDFIEQYRPIGLVADTKKFNFLISVEMQEWTNTVVFPRIIAAGVEKFALVVSEDIITQLALEQTMDEEKTGAFVSKYFENEADALKWLKK